MRALTYLVVALAALVLLPWDWTVLPGPVVRDETPTEADQPLDTPSYTRDIIYFPCSGVRCQAWLYLPKHTDSSTPPVVVAAHGLGAQKDMCLAAYGERFAAAGLASFIFDYRTFGGSDGEPRHWVSPKRHIADWQSAITYVTLHLSDTVDTSKLMLWSTSFGAGHALTIAAQLGDKITAVVAQAPFVDGKATFVRGVKEHGYIRLVRAVAAAVHDTLRGLINFPAAYYPLIGEVGGINVMGASQDEIATYYALHPAKPQGGWRNMARCRLALEVSSYRPITVLPKIKAPVLYAAATKDHLCPLAEVEAALNATPNGQLITVDTHHFQVYMGEPFEFLTGKYTEFYRAAAGLPKHMKTAVAETQTE